MADVPRWQLSGAVTYATAALLLIVGLGLLAAPNAVPDLTVPGDGGAMDHPRGSSTMPVP